MARRKKLPPVLETMGTKYREAMALADKAEAAFNRLHKNDPRVEARDRKIERTIMKALKGAGLDYEPEFMLDAPRHDDSLTEIRSACCEFSLCITGLEDGDYAKVVRVLRTLGFKNPLDHAKPDAVEYTVELN
jgi:hypothetical protein